MDKTELGRCGQIEAILSAVDSGALTFTEINRRLDAIVNAELSKPEAEMDMGLFNACQTLLWDLNSPDPYVSKMEEEKARLKKAIERKVRVRSLRIKSLAAVGAAAMILGLTFVGDPLLTRQWLTGEQRGDEQQYIISGKKQDPGLLGEANALQRKEEVEVTTESLEELIQVMGYKPALPEWLPQGWKVDSYYFYGSVVFDSLTVSYENTDQELVYTITEYHDSDYASEYIEQNEKGEYVDCHGMKVYMAFNMDRSVCSWSKELTHYTLFGSLNRQELLKIIASVKE